MGFAHPQRPIPAWALLRFMLDATWTTLGRNRGRRTSFKFSWIGTANFRLVASVRASVSVQPTDRLIACGRFSGLTGALFLTHSVWTRFTTKWPCAVRCAYLWPFRLCFGAFSSLWIGGGDARETQFPSAGSHRCLGDMQRTNFCAGPPALERKPSPLANTMRPSLPRLSQLMSVRNWSSWLRSKVPLTGRAASRRIQKVKCG